MELPLISIIIPVYKVEAYLDQCIRSVAEQTYQNLEILLVDDGSPDNCGAICDAWAEKDSRIRVIHQENGGLSAARNAGLEAASGQLVGFVDSDDYIRPEMYQLLYSLMDEETEIAECACVRTTDDFAVFGPLTEKGRFYSAQEAMSLMVQETLFHQITCNKLYRRGVIGDILFPVGKINEDEFWTYQVIGRAKKLAHCESACYAYRQRPGSIMHKTYSLRNLDGIFAKHQRLGYIRRHMPQIADEAAMKMYWDCLFSMQRVLRGMKGEERQQARRFLYGILEDVTPLPGIPLPLKRRVLLAMSRVSFEGTARFLTFLNRIHILT